MKIKVCGMRDAQNIRDVAALDIDLMGFIFYPKSPRFVSLISSQAGIIPDYSPERLNMAVNADGKPGYIFPKRIKRVGVFVDEMPQTIITYVYNYSLDYIQLHGKETPTLIDNLRRTLVPDLVPDIKVIKAFGITSADDLQQCAHRSRAVAAGSSTGACSRPTTAARPFCSVAALAPKTLTASRLSTIRSV